MIMHCCTQCLFGRIAILQVCIECQDDDQDNGELTRGNFLFNFLPVEFNTCTTQFEFRAQNQNRCPPDVKNHRGRQFRAFSDCAHCT